MDETVSLNEIPLGQPYAVRRLCVEETLRRRLLELGLVEGTTLALVGQSPAGDPKAFWVRGAMIALRARDCRRIFVDAIPPDGCEGRISWGDAKI